MKPFNVSEVGIRLAFCRSIAPDAFSAVPSLQRLDLAKNQLSGILDPKALRGRRGGEGFPVDGFPTQGWTQAEKHGEFQRKIKCKLTVRL